MCGDLAGRHISNQLPLWHQFWFIPTVQGGNPFFFPGGKQAGTSTSEAQRTEPPPRPKSLTLAAQTVPAFHVKHVRSRELALSLVGVCVCVFCAVFVLLITVLLVSVAVLCYLVFGV